MKKKNVALLLGGYSGEYEISLKSGKNIIENIDKEKFNIYPIIIEKSSWYFADKNIEIDKSDFSLNIDGEKVSFDVVYPMIHGTPGEDGKLLAYFDLLNIPYVGCNMFEASVTFNKFYCKSIVSSLGVPVAKSYFLTQKNYYPQEEIIEKLGVPCFVKPNKNGSSVGISKVHNADEIINAIDNAFKEDDEVLIEEFLSGRELTCGAYRNGETMNILPITEVVPKKEFFDFEAKYQTSLSEEITPANIDEETAIAISTYTNLIYNMLNCKGVIRVDYIVNENNIYFLEVNAAPGMSVLSIIPQQLKEYGVELKDFITMLIEQALT
ncbi:D-alanine--D-alanine ligase [Odoribacter sp. OttesenSCG-928-L07]|nr:D-alanine--D-alanine ligase [Odoribacter sp. OttesenSCG-928-L07]MDL2239240.1 D-alanine--D-alanine ligase [Bacteroidales bacterium OttesenSCG-928-L14]MDL2240046.1 D-alanine--D-alanine ligase [Bacteroidales bacterium OttesenSCG-928-K22]